jgi:hypothetical protein
MRIRNTTLAALWPILFVGSVALAAAGDRYFSNPTQDKDVIIQVNKAGVKTDAIKVSGTTGAVTTLGRTDGSAPAAGEVGEYKESLGSSIIVVTSRATLTSLTLPAGVWDITGAFNIGSATGTFIQVAISTTAASAAGTTAGYDLLTYAFDNSSGNGSAAIPRKRVSISSSTTYYLNGLSNAATVSGMSYSITAVRQP